VVEPPVNGNDFGLDAPVAPVALTAPVPALGVSAFPLTTPTAGVDVSPAPLTATVVGLPPAIVVDVAFRPPTVDVVVEDTFTACVVVVGVPHITGIVSCTCWGPPNVHVMSTLTSALSPCICDVSDEMLTFVCVVF
jgi:hypothetical protein